MLYVQMMRHLSNIQTVTPYKIDKGAAVFQI